MPRRRRLIRGTSKPIHPTEWCGQDVLVNTHTAPGSLESVIVDDTRFAEFTNPTIVRIRGVIWVTMSFTQVTANLQGELALGIRTVQNTAVAIESLLTETGQEQPWMWLDYVHTIDEIQASTTFTSAGAVTTDFTRRGGRWQQRLEVDVKAMRRVPQGHSLVLQTTFAEIADAPDMAVRGMLRALVKE